MEQSQPQRTCPYCRQSRHIVKAGLNRAGSQRMRCQECRRYFTPQPKPMGYDQATREMALRLYLEGISFRAIGRLLSVNYVSVINWVNVHEKTLPHKVEDQTPTDTVEVDELFTFIGGKRRGSERVYVVVSVAREEGEQTDCGSRCD